VTLERSSRVHSSAVHDGLVVECQEGQAEQVSRFVEEGMVARMHEVLNLSLDAHHLHEFP
jgi:DNA polymerase I-like protein with 3'-5' exonuclease and polymerase domains